jgi:hypothetical protein
LLLKQINQTPQTNLITSSTKIVQMKKRIFTLFLGTLLITINTFGQQKTVTGKVTDGSSRPLVGVTVKLKGKASTAGSTTTTDAGGNYSIEAKKGQTIVFSFVGTISQERIVGTDPAINISLNEDPKSLDAVVVVGYGNQKNLT